jgi:V/A-type H+-transporting ATPase subunit A
MGFGILLLADSTSRWAQALRETSANLEEIPGEEAYPAYLDSAIKEVYERAGVLRMADGSEGSLTMIGTVSPAGGNFEEPVTQSTLSTVKTFLGLSYDRAYKRAYPAIDPLISWSRYLEQLRLHYAENFTAGGLEMVNELKELLVRGKEIYKMMQVTGEEGITLADFILYRKSMLLDMVYLQQDAFDEVDVSTSIERQQESLMRLKKLIDAEYDFDGKDEVRDFFTRLTDLLKNLNYAEPGSQDYFSYADKVESLLPGTL